MDESERIQRLRNNLYVDNEEALHEDAKLANRIAALLHHMQIDENCMVDAYYYDFSVIPDYIREQLNLWRDCYLIFGITTKGEIISRWVDRWALDSDDPIIGGEVIHSNMPSSNNLIPEIQQSFNRMLLSTPCPDIFNTRIKDCE